MSRKLLNPFLSASLLVLSALAALPAHAGPLVRMDLVDRDTGALLPAWPHRGDTWVPGTPGHRYGVRLANQSGERVLVVLSVDGVNAVTGQTATPGQAGYVLEPWATAEITGWRKSLQGVAQFVFTDPGDSYAARTGRPRDVGVVGIAVFTEARQRYPMPPPAVAGASPRERRQEADARAPAAQESARDAYADRTRTQSLGTGHGQHEWSPVSQTGFVRASRHPAQVTELRYEDGHELARRGIVPRGPRWAGYGPSRPRAFPGGFVPDP